MTTNIPFKNLTHEESYYSDLLCYGKAVRVLKQRKWYNPMKHFRGEFYYHWVPAEKVWQI